MLITRETKLAIVKKHLIDGVTLKELENEYLENIDIQCYCAENLLELRYLCVWVLNINAEY